MNPQSHRLAVCSWSLQPSNPSQLVENLCEIGIFKVQLALDPLRENPALWEPAAQMLSNRGIQIVSGMFGTVGEDYSTLESIRQSGGVVPDHNWDQNWSQIQQSAQLATELGIKLVTFHAGFLPHKESDPAFTKLLGRIRQIGELFGNAGIELGFETGQETAETLGTFLARLNMSGVGVNFDPANLLLYDKGDPIAALEHLSPWLKQCHIKDANRTRVPGAWGEEVVVGTGQVDWKAFFRTLHANAYHGPLAIEREAGNHRIADIRSARAFIEALPE